MKFKEQIPYWILVIVYSVGIFGLTNDVLQPYFMQLTALNLLLTLLWYYWMSPKPLKSITEVSPIVFLIGYLVEVAGVQTGLLFGEYSYGKTLGFSFADVPLIIGVNWLILSLSSHGIVARFTEKTSLLVLIPAGLMTLLDFCIEPVAIKLDFWSWTEGYIPIQNYLMWFIVAAVIHRILVYFKLKLNFTASIAVFATQVVFFVCLNVLL